MIMKTNNGSDLMKAGCALMFLGIVGMPVVFAGVVAVLTLINWSLDWFIGK